MLNLATYSAPIYLECAQVQLHIKNQFTLNLSVIIIHSSWSVYSYMSNITCQIYSLMHLTYHNLSYFSAKQIKHLLLKVHTAFRDTSNIVLYLFCRSIM